MSGALARLAPAVALCAFLLLALTSAASHSGTFDESGYLAEGYSYWRFGDYRLNTMHPPLAKLLVAAPLLAMDARMDPNDPSWVEAHPWKFPRRFVYDWNRAQRLLFSGRAANAALALCLIVVVWLWTRHHWGVAAGRLALLLCAASPELLAHGSLATTDLAAAAFVFASVVAFERALFRPRLGSVLLAGGALGCALLSKHTALAMLGILPLLAVAHALWRSPAGESRRSAVGRGLLLAALCATITYPAIWAGYRFRFQATADPALTEPLRWRPVTAPGLEQLRQARLLPEAYVHGLSEVMVKSQDRRAFALGRISSEGFWYYFPLTFALKTPLPLIALLVIALAVPAATGPSRAIAACVWLPVVVFTAAAIASRLNIGHRHLLPIHAFLIVAAASAAPKLLARGRRGRALLLLLGAWYAAGTALNHPHHLAYFNELAGGPSQGYRWLADSNVDWGQDLIRLKRYMDEQRLASVKLSYFGTAAPEAYGIRHELLPSVMRPFPERLTLLVRPGDVVAISATNLQGVYLPRAARRLMERFKEQQPIARVGRSLFVYRAEFAWLLRPEMAQELGWLDDAIAAYREALRLDPNDATAREFLERADALR